MSTPTIGSAARAGAVTDLVTTEVVRHGLDTAADQMRLTLQRTAFSPIIYEMTDFAAVLYDADLRLLAQARALPLFMGTLGHCIERTVAHVGGPEALVPGDVLFTTYGFDTGSHPQDATVVLPHFVGDQLVAYAAIKAHHLDIGAKDAYCTDTTDNFQEGVIFPGVKLYRAGVLEQDMYRTIIANSRTPAAMAGDLQAQIGAARVGLQALDRLIDRYGVPGFRAACEAMLDHGEKVMRAFTTEIPDGRYEAAGALDNDGIHDDPIPFRVAIEIHGSDVTIDFSDAPPAVSGPLNVPYATTLSAARIALMTLAGGRATASEGFFRPLSILTKPGTIFDPQPPAPIFMYFWPAMQAVDLIHRALADAIPDRIPAGNGGDLNALMWWGYDEHGTFWVDGTDHMVGSGAMSGADGGAPLMHITGSGITTTPIEALEARRPIVTERFELAQDSGGPGRTRGGLGLDLHYRAVRETTICAPLERLRTPPWGLHGGQAGRPTTLTIRRADGSREQHLKVTGLVLAPGDVIELDCSAGGGFGPAGERAAEDVRADLRAEYVSEAAARRDYPHAF